MLDDIPSSELVAELLRRHYLRTAVFKCPRCKASLTDRDGKELNDPKVTAKECSCSFGNVDETYHAPHTLNMLQEQLRQIEKAHQILKDLKVV